jgi:hypothetical protein
MDDFADADRAIVNDVFGLERRIVPRAPVRNQSSFHAPCGQAHHRGNALLVVMTLTCVLLVTSAGRSLERPPRCFIGTVSAPNLSCSLGCAWGVLIERTQAGLHPAWAEGKRSGNRSALSEGQRSAAGARCRRDGYRAPGAAIRNESPNDFEGQGRLNGK